MHQHHIRTERGKKYMKDIMSMYRSGMEGESHKEMVSTTVPAWFLASN